MAMATLQSSLTLWRLAVLLLCFTVSLLFWHHVLMQPTCDGDSSSTSLKVMVIADLHLAGPGTAWVDRVRRESFMRAALRIAYNRLHPDALIVLGDLSDAGRKSTDAQWDAVMARFRDLVRPFHSVPIQIVVGNHDVGDHYDPGFSTRLSRFAASFPGLDESLGSIFTWNGINFVSLNAMALPHDLSHNASSNSPTVLSLHLPLHRVAETECSGVDVPRCAPWHDLEGPCLPLGSETASGRELSHRIGVDVVPATASARVLHALRPRLVLSGHTHRWCDRVHGEGVTREVTVPSLSWRNRDDPGFAFLTFEKNCSSFMLQRCNLAHESTVIVVYVLWACSVFSWGVLAAFFLVHRFRSKSVKPE